MAPTDTELAAARKMVAEADGATAATSLNARRSAVYPVCRCNASTLPHRHAHDGIVDLTAEEMNQAAASAAVGTRRIA
jgi:hypothetical protein